MNVLLYIDGIDTLSVFEEVSHHTQQAIQSMKINPNCGDSTLKVSLGIGRRQLLDKTLKVFENIDTLRIPFELLNKFEDSFYDKYELIEIYKFARLNLMPSKYSSLAKKITSLGIDCAYVGNYLLEQMGSLQELTVRIEEKFSAETAKQVFEAVKQLPSLHRLSIHFDETTIDTFKPFISCLPSKVAVSLQCMWLSDNGHDNLLSLIPFTTKPIGIWDCSISILEDWMINNPKIVLVPLIKGCYHIPPKSLGSFLFSQFEKLYYPAKTHSNY